jgi:hypothetical protein
MNVLKVLFELVAYLSMAPLCVLFILNEVPGSVFVFLFSLLSLGLTPIACELVAGRVGNGSSVERAKGEVP